MPAILRPLVARDPDEQHRAATTLELLFDLISVIAIASVTAGLHHAIAAGHGLEALPRFVFLFLAIWWAWMNFTWFASAFDNDDGPYRLLVMVIMCGALVFAGGAGQIFETLDLRWGLLGWIIMRFGMVGLWLRAAAGCPEFRTTALRYAAGIVVAQIAWTACYFASEPGSMGFYLLGMLCFLVEWAVPPYAESARQTPFHRHHIIERYGLLMIISLGEIMLSISHGFGALFGDHPVYGAAVVSVSALVIVFSIWWIYFCEEEHLVSKSLATALVWGYGHVFIFMATAALGAAVAASIDVVTHHAHADQKEVSHWLGGSLALGALALWVARDRVLPIAPALKAALPVMAAANLLAGILGQPVWVFALLAVGTILWRAPGTAPRRPAQSVRGAGTGAAARDGH
ncbi:MAG: low temperature requirement protein A [Defluviimonas sp.]|uniref:low temperature requirement protein A n=1 Tax=Albidovulum sp. TaxID=1872424 RepID=UPI001DFF7EFC|nr:low temperature requirement protein A [Paracoccaceae bacterium]MCC0064240.1 low temperature requirement protein A [Defluviimonas sp.]